MIEDFAATYCFIRFVRNEKNLGVLSMCVRGLSLGNGDRYYGAAADDRVLPGAIESLMDMATEYPEVGIVYGLMLVENDAGE